LFGYPKTIYDPYSPFSPYAAVSKAGDVFLLKGNLAFRFDTVKLRVLDYPQRVRDLFPELPNWMEVCFYIFFCRLEVTFYTFQGCY
jgi:hypothetical protein